ncbi:MAG: gamma-glutamyltransferase family protein, partial [Phycisphaeraceae bacterium]
SNGIGGDAFAIIHHHGQLHGLNASGRSPAAWTPDRFADLEHFPTYGPDTVTVPGVVSAWSDAHHRFGRLPFADLFQDAIRYARDGFPVGPVTAAAWHNASKRLVDRPDWSHTFLFDGNPPAEGQLIKLPHHARTLETIATDHGESFYHGDLAHQIAAHVQSQGGALAPSDLATHTNDWVAPLSLTAFGRTLHELPPNGQGIAALIALGIAERLPLRDLDPDTPEAIHLQAEAIRLAFADLHAYNADPDHLTLNPAALLHPDYLDQRAALVNPHRASAPTAGVPTAGGTVYCCAADASGMMVSWIQSNFHGFGSGLVVPHTGIALQNRAAGFVLTPNHPNHAGPNKRPFHTIIPAFITRDGQPEAAFGVMGGSFQAQGHLQVFLRRHLWNQSPQQAADAPRWMITHDHHLALEPSWPPVTTQTLTRLGHTTRTEPPTTFGGAQGIWKLPSHHYAAMSDWRKEGQAEAY